MTYQELSGWGRSPKLYCRTMPLARQRTGTDDAASSIVRGLGRAYGDSALNPDMTFESRRMDCLLAFDTEDGVLEAEAGAMLGDMVRAVLPKGWFVPVTPGTQYVTLGGMIAADVHGKNHHLAGTFGDFVEWFDLRGKDGLIQRCSPSENAEIFNATLGGMGLTGQILRARFRLIPVDSGWIAQDTLVAANLGEAIDLMEAHLSSTYSVAWIDCLAQSQQLGRSLVYLGEHAAFDTLPPRERLHRWALEPRKTRRVPLDFPAMALNGLSVKVFNEVYFRSGSRKAGEMFAPWETYFYPLDAIRDWNRIYGARGFAQFQCVVPLAGAREGMRALVETIAASGMGSFLAVLTRTGPAAEPSRLLSFPIEGYTLALDFPVSAGSLALMDQLDAITLDHGGRTYLAKDSRMSRATFDRMDSMVLCQGSCTEGPFDGLDLAILDCTDVGDARLFMGEFGADTWGLDYHAWIGPVALSAAR